MTCSKPPTGWSCSRDAGHEGSCAAWPAIYDAMAMRAPTARPDVEAKLRGLRKPIDDLNLPRSIKATLREAFDAAFALGEQHGREQEREAIATWLATREVAVGYENGSCEFLADELRERK